MNSKTVTPSAANRISNVKCAVYSSFGVCINEFYALTSRRMRLRYLPEARRSKSTEGRRRTRGGRREEEEEDEKWDYISGIIKF